MVKRTKKILLVCGNQSAEFGIQHATRLLAMGEGASGGWRLPNDSKYVYDKENGIRLKPDTAVTGQKD